MAWSDPSNPVASTVITVAYAVANFLTQIRWLRAMTGGADPPGSNYTLRSTSTTGTEWSVVTTDMIANNAVTNSKLPNNSIDLSTKAAAGSLTGDRVASKTLPQAALGLLSVGTPELIDLCVTPGKIAASAVQTAAINDGAVTPVKGGVPSGAVVWFETLAELTAAGAAWARYTAADGRMLVGAGSSASSQTFVEATDYGANWTPATAVGVNVGTLAATVGTLGVSIPAAAVSAASGGAGGSSFALQTHGHSGSITGSPGLSGSPAISGTSTVWVPYMRAGIWGRKT